MVRRAEALRGLVEARRNTMTKSSIAALAIVLSMAAPAFAEDGPATDGLSEVSTLGTIAAGQPSYVLDPSGRLIDRQQLGDQAGQHLVAGIVQADTPLGRTEMPTDWRDSTP
jgi:hypothetical protein